LLNKVTEIFFQDIWQDNFNSCINFLYCKYTRKLLT